MPKRIPSMDLSWLVLESPDTPMHVGGLLTFALPDRAPEEYLQNLAATLRDQRGFQAPWNLKVSFAPSGISGNGTSTGVCLLGAMSARSCVSIWSSSSF